jgi:hypothetical protein
MSVYKQQLPAAFPHALDVEVGRELETLLEELNSHRDMPSSYAVTSDTAKEGTVILWLSRVSMSRLKTAGLVA